MGEEIEIPPSADGRDAGPMTAQRMTISRELNRLLPKLAAGGVMPKRHAIVGNSRVTLSVFVNSDGSPIVRFDKTENGSLGRDETDCLHDAVASVATIGGTIGGTSLRHVTFRLVGRVYDRT